MNDILNVIASVTDTLTGLEYNRTVVVKVVGQKYHLEFYNHHGMLKPSLNFSAQAHFLNSVEVLVLHTLYDSPSGSYVQIHRYNSFAEVGIPFQLSAESNYPLTELHYVVTTRGHVVSAGTVTSGSFSLTPEESWTPMAYLVVFNVRPDGEIVNDAARFPVHQLPRDKVSLSWGQVTARPKEDVSLIVIVTDPQALVGIRVVDKATECLQSGNDLTEVAALGELDEENMDQNNIPSLMGDPFSAFTACNLMVLTDAILPGDIGHGRSYAGQGMAPEPRGCRNSPETWIWLETNASKSAITSLQVTVPDRSTSWFASAFVVSDNLGLGFTSTPVQLSVSRDFVLSLDLPPYIIRGERLVLEVQLFNNLEQHLSAIVIVESSEWFDFIFAGDEMSSTAGARIVSMQNRDSVTVLFPIRLKALGMAPVTVRAISAHDSDEVTGMVLVKSEGVEKTFSMSVFLEMAPFEQKYDREFTFTFPPNVMPGSKRVEVAIVGNILGPSLAGLDNLILLPGGCGEQNMINFAPNIYVLEYLTNTGQVDDNLYSRAIGYMATGYRNQLNYRRIDGSFSAFGSSDSSGSTWLSAFVLRSFLQARPFMVIEDAVLNQIASWLVAQQGPDGVFAEPGRVIHTEMQGGLDGPVSLTFHSDGPAGGPDNLYGSMVSKALDFLESKVNEGISSDYSLCLVTYALSLSQRNSAKTALAQLLQRADMQDGVPFWNSPVGGLSPSWQPSSIDIEMAGYTLLSLFTQFKVVEGLALMKWLSQQRNHLGGYGSTQDTIVALQGLSLYAGFSGSAAIDLNITVIAMGSNAFSTFHINSINSLVRQSQEISILETGKDIHLNVSMEGRGFAMFQLNVFYNVDSSLPPVKRSVASQGEAFELDILVNDDDLDHLTLTVCFRLREGLGINQTGMAILDVGLLSGFRMVEDGVEIDDFVKKVETPHGKIILYLDSVNTSQVCIEIPTERDFKVAGVHEALVVVYDYYEPRRQTAQVYNSELMKRASFCSFCGHNCSNCGEKPVVSSASITSSQRHRVASLTCALVIVATFIH
ncbi:hypothetical protein AAFF_G00068860 [Aldrovandia affinis]|uniref:Uncharacterized protein n=1 Tax=Aldrovandia affinis TaxID=143900 RepID=A0AAD7WDG0_9TELE|nr:hypothetical protein AAFF_G00068860 [Aldrovandia affinis]